MKHKESFEDNVTDRIYFEQTQNEMHMICYKQYTTIPFLSMLSPAKFIRSVFRTQPNIQDRALCRKSQRLNTVNYFYKTIRPTRLAELQTLVMIIGAPYRAFYRDQAKP